MRVPYKRWPVESDTKAAKIRHRSVIGVTALSTVFARPLSHGSRTVIAVFAGHLPVFDEENMKTKAIVLTLLFSLALWAQTAAPPVPSTGGDTAVSCPCCKNMEQGKTCADCCKDGKCAMADGKACCKDGKCAMAESKGCCAGMKDGKSCCARGKDGKMSGCCKQANQGKGCCGKACMRTSKAA